MKNVFVGISHGFQVRNFLQTPFILKLVQRYHVVIIVDHSDFLYMQKYVASMGIVNVEVRGIRIKESKHENIFMVLRKNIFVSPKRVSSKNIMNEMNSRTLGKWKPLLNVFNRIFGTYEFTRSIWRGIEKLFVNGKEFDQLFEEFKPIKVVSADYGTRPFEIRLLRSSRRHRVDSVSVVPSWDNLTSKGVMGIKPDKLVVWNDVMANEAMELHSFKKTDIVVAGPLQFDNFFNDDFKYDRATFNLKFGISENQPVIVYGTISPKYFKYNIDVLNILKESIEKQEIKGNPKILIRIHPQVVKDPVYGDDMNVYKELANTSNIFCLSLPEIEDWETMQVPSITDYHELVSLLSYSNVTLASASTLIFDSFACDTPFIGIGFDGNMSGLPKNKSVRRMFEFEHYNHVYKLKGFKIAESKDELIAYINEYLKDRSIDRSTRQMIKEQQIKFFDGKSYERVINAIG